MYSSSREFLFLNLDDTYELADNLEEGASVFKSSQIDLYMNRPKDTELDNITIVDFYKTYRVTNSKKSMFPDVKIRNKEPIIIIRPNRSSDPKSEYYEEYCKQQMIRRVPFRDYSDLKPDESTSWVSIYEELMELGSDERNIDHNFATEVRNADLVAVEAKEDNAGNYDPEAV